MTGGEKRDMVTHSIHKKAHENSPPKENIYIIGGEKRDMWWLLMA